MRSRTFRRGFTLVEIMIVVLIIGLLLAIAVPNWNTARARSRASGMLSDLRQIETAKEQYILSAGLAPGDNPDWQTALVPGFMNIWPIGPVSPGVYAANAVGQDPSFNGNNANWYEQHCLGSTADSQCPF